MKGDAFRARIYPVAASKTSRPRMEIRRVKYHPRPETHRTVKSKRPFERQQSPYCPSYRLRRFRACVQTLLTPWLYQARVSFAILEKSQFVPAKGGTSCLIKRDPGAAPTANPTTTTPASQLSGVHVGK